MEIHGGLSGTIVSAYKRSSEGEAKIFLSHENKRMNISHRALNVHLKM